MSITTEPNKMALASGYLLGFREDEWDFSCVRRGMPKVQTYIHFNRLCREQYALSTIIDGHSINTTPSCKAKTS